PRLASPQAISRTSVAARAQVQVCQMPRSFSRTAGASGRCLAWASSSFGKVSALVSTGRNVGRTLTPACRSNDNPRDTTPRTFPMVSRASVQAGRSIRDRVRAPTGAELAAVPWLDALTPAERRYAEAAIVVGEAEVGDLVCRIGRAPT